MSEDTRPSEDTDNRGADLNESNPREIDPDKVRRLMEAVQHEFPVDSLTNRQTALLASACVAVDELLAHYEASKPLRLKLEAAREHHIELHHIIVRSCDALARTTIARDKATRQKTQNAAKNLNLISQLFSGKLGNLRGVSFDIPIGNSESDNENDNEAAQGAQPSAVAPD